MQKKGQAGASIYRGGERKKMSGGLRLEEKEKELPRRRVRVG